MVMKHTISVIIPVLNEAAFIGRLLEHLAVHSSAEHIEEIIVVDGGSTDGSQAVVAAFDQVRLLDGPKGRARQLNVGAQSARGSILYFLHADSFPPPQFDRKIIRAVERSCAGCFRLAFQNPKHFLLKIAGWFTQFHSSFFRGGDQSLFIIKKEFEVLEGYDERYVVFEDVELIERIYQRCEFAILNDYIVTSARRFTENGVWQLYFHFLVVHLKQRWGASPEELHQYYLRNIR